MLRFLAGIGCSRPLQLLVQVRELFERSASDSAALNVVTGRECSDQRIERDFATELPFLSPCDRAPPRHSRTSCEPWQYRRKRKEQTTRIIRGSVNASKRPYRKRTNWNVTHHNLSQCLATLVLRSASRFPSKRRAPSRESCTPDQPPRISPL